jgi:hypothetical protein
MAFSIFRGIFRGGTPAWLGVLASPECAGVKGCIVEAALAKFDYF